MDLALARLAESKLATGRETSLSLQRWQALCHQCREAKEKILGGTAEEETITLVGGGRRLVGGTVTTTVGKREIEEILLQGFSPSSIPSRRRPWKRAGESPNSASPTRETPP